jgi:uncharacterized protein
MTRSVRWCLMLLGLVTFPLLLGGCGSTKQARFYTLNPAISAPSGATAESPSPSAAPAYIGIAAVEIPDYLDRPQITTRSADSGLEVAEFDRWAGELQKDVARVLAETMSAQLGDNSVFVLTGRRAVPADYRVTVHVTRFERMPDNAVWLKALWTVLAKDGRRVAARGESNLAEPVHGGDYGATVAAMSRAVDQLGKEIAGAMRPVLARGFGSGTSTAHAQQR